MSEFPFEDIHLSFHSVNILGVRGWRTGVSRSGEIHGSPMGNPNMCIASDTIFGSLGVLGKRPSAFRIPMSPILDTENLTKANQFLSFPISSMTEFVRSAGGFPHRNFTLTKPKRGRP